MGSSNVDFEFTEKWPPQPPGMGPNPITQQDWMDITEQGSVPDPHHKLETVLEEAQRLVYGDREESYGHPRDNMRAVALLLTAYLRSRGVLQDGSKLAPGDAAVMMLLLKVARYSTGNGSRDTCVDLAGYAAVLARTEGLDP